MDALYPLPVDFESLKRPEGIRSGDIFKPVEQTGDYRFLHGVAIHAARGKWFASFGYNEGAENSVTERLTVLISEDAGESWSPFQCLSHPDWAFSHCAFIEADGLYMAVPSFRGLGEPLYTEKGDKLIRFTGLHMRIFRLGAERFEELPGQTPDFWPLGPACRLPGGGLIMPGCDGNWLGAVAICDRGDGMFWRVCPLTVGGHAYTECNLTVWRNNVMAVMRNQSKPAPDGRLYAACCVSRDGGAHFEPAYESALPMNASKPCMGRLPDGRHYIVFNHQSDSPYARGRLLLGVSEGEEPAFTRFFLLDEDQTEKWLCYPYGAVIGDELIVVYSAQSAGAQARGEKRMNRNDARMARVPLRALRASCRGKETER